MLKKKIIKGIIFRNIILTLRGNYFNIEKKCLTIFTGLLKFPFFELLIIFFHNFT